MLDGQKRSEKAAESNARKGDVDKTTSGASAAVLTAGGVCLAFLVKEAISNSQNINIKLGALIKQAQVVEDTSTVANSVAGRSVGDLVAAGDLHVVSASIVGLGDGDLINGRVSPDLGTGGHGGGEESDDGHVLHLEVLGLSKTEDSKEGLCGFVG